MTDISFSEFLAAIEKASFRKAPPVADEPLTSLERWSVRLVHGNFCGEGDSIHFVGWAGYEGRVCSPIKSWDAVSRCGISRSGRHYKLVGSPGQDADAEYVFERWLAHNGDPQWEDITDKWVSDDLSDLHLQSSTEKIL